MWFRMSSIPGGASSSTLAMACCAVMCSCRCAAISSGVTLCAFSTKNAWKLRTSSVA